MPTTKPNYVELPVAQAEAITNKAKYWRAYLTKKRETILNTPLSSPDSFYFLEIASFWASLFAYIEWLTCFYYLKNDLRPYKNFVAPVLFDAWGWKEDLSIIFWRAGRNPFAHVAQVNSFHHYPGCFFDNHPAYVQFDINRWSNQALADMKRVSKFQGVIIISQPNDGFYSKRGAVTISFFFAAIEPLLEIIADFVAKKISKLTDTKNLDSLYKLNKQILH